MDIRVQISEITPHLFLTAAQVIQNSSQSFISNNPQVIKSEISEPMMDPVAGADDSHASENGDAEEEEYEVETILDTKMEKGKRLYRVRWKNFTEEWDTWEPEAVLKDGAEETLKEYIKNNEALMKSSKAPKNAKSRKRPAATRTRSSSKTKTRRVTLEDADDESLPDSASEESEGEAFTPPSAKTKKGRPKKSKTPSSAPSSSKPRGRASAVSAPKPPVASSADRSTPSAAASNSLSTNGFLSNKTPWFMGDSSSDEDENNKEKQQQKEDDDTNSKPSTPTMQKQDVAKSSKDVASSSSLKIVIKNQKPSKEDNDQSDASSSKKYKKDKHKKKNKKAKTELLFEGIYRKAPGEPLSFVAQTIANDTTTSYSLEEALETDAKSLARFLADKITFEREGIPSINVINASSSS